MTTYATYITWFRSGTCVMKKEHVSVYYWVVSRGQ